MTEIKKLQPMSLEEFDSMPKQEGWIYELLDGVVMMSPRPTIQHQLISGNLLFALRNSLKGSGCHPVQEIDLALESNILEPNLLVICEELTALAEMKRYEKPPLIAVEIVSPFNASHDYITKRYKYEQLGVKEYWIVSPEEKRITVINFAAGTCVIVSSGQLKSTVMPDIVIDLNDIFV